MKTFEQMIDGYRNFRAGDWHEERERWAELAEGQSPQVMVISCSDSRVDPAQILDVAPGEIFVVRNVAALVPPFETTPGRHGVSAAVEFAVQFLKVKEILVMGHGLCGGCKAALTQDLHGNEIGEGGFVAHWVDMLDEAREPIAAQLGHDGQDRVDPSRRRVVRVDQQGDVFQFFFSHARSHGGAMGEAQVRRRV